MASHCSPAVASAAHPDRGSQPAPRLRPVYRRVIIVDGRQQFAAVRDRYDAASDLVLTYDFGLRKEIRSLGGDALYVDQLRDADTMQDANLRLYRFFERWHLDEDGRDIFTHDDVPFGFAFRLEFWNDFIFHARTWLCVSRLAELKYESLHVGTALGEVEDVLRAMDMPFTPVPAPANADGRDYFFPIHQWMAANIRRRGAKATAVNVFAWALSRTLALSDALTGWRRRPSILVQEYFPTAGIIARLRSDPTVRVVGPQPTRANLFARFIPLPRRSGRHARVAAALMEKFRARRCERLVLGDGRDISDHMYRLIEARVAPRAAESVRTIEGAVAQLRRDPFRLVLLISNIGEIITLVNCACRARGIPSFLIINGLLAAEYGDDSKHATMINAYSPSIRDHYFRGMDNIVCLGDPRMDAYPPVPRRASDPSQFSITIGASGFNPTDLNSFVAVEFEFISGVLEAIQRVRRGGASIRVVIKVRANGSRQQYDQFAAEYFPGLVSEIVDDVSMRSVLQTSDLFVSIYSQTLFEASCMGIPVIYYRVGDVFKYPPFDGHPPLVAAHDVDSLEQAIEDFRARHARFDSFLERQVMEQFIGPLDGQNLERNLAFVRSMLASPAARTAS